MHPRHKFILQIGKFDKSSHTKGVALQNNNRKEALFNNEVKVFVKIFLDNAYCIDSTLTRQPSVQFQRLWGRGVGGCGKT